MTMKRTPRPRDPIQLGKLMVDIMTGRVPDAVDDGKDAVKAAQTSEAGTVGGKARAERLSADERSRIAKAGASKRWHGDKA